MSISLADQLSAAEQGLQVDQARLSKLQAEREELVASGGDTSSIDSQISIAQADVNGSLQDVADAQQNINNQAQETVAATETASTQPTEPDTSTAEDNANQETLSDDEIYSLNRTEYQDDNGEANQAAVEDAVAKENSDDQLKEKTTVVTTTTTAAANEVPSPIPNPLHSYATYTYGITLFILSKDDFNRLQKADVKELPSWNPTYALISSAGRYQSGTTLNGTTRQASFKEDFYFDNLRMKTVVGMNSQTRGTNAVEISFNIIEPYGMTLLDRMIDAAKQVGSKNYLEQPYLLQIDFFGSDALGETHTPIPTLSKRIPVKFVALKIKVGTKGAEYAVQAIPYNHSALRETTAVTPANFEVVATTVNDFFQNTLSDSFEGQLDYTNSSKEKLATANRQAQSAELTAEELAAIRTTQEESKSALAKPLQNDSYTGAVNAWNQKLIDRKHARVPNIYNFVIDESFRDSPIVDPAKVYLNRMDFTPSSDTAQKSNNSNVSSKTPAVGLNRNKMTFNINAGTSIIDVINMVMKNSKYIKDQVTDPLSEKTNFAENQSVKFYKIIPQISLGEFDEVRQTYGKVITYHVKPYEYFNSKHPSLPYATPGGAVKEYNYMYTGKNIDIIDFSIDFDTAFYTSVNVNRDNAEAGNPVAKTPEDQGQNKLTYGASPDSIGNNKLVFIENDLSVTASFADSAETNLTAGVVKNIYSESRGDMINVKLKILGDPQFIKQDDIYANPGQPNYDSKNVMLNSGTVAMDKSEIFCKITFFTPVDMDDRTGLARINGRYSISKFSGLYKILTVDSEFSRGQFVQSLECVRIFDKPVAKKADPNRENPAAPKTDTDQTQRTDDKSDNDIKSDTDYGTPENRDDNSDALIQEQIEEDFELALAEDTSDAETQYEDDYDSEWSFAELENAELDEDIAEAEELDYDEQQTADNNSVEPENPEDVA